MELRSEKNNLRSKAPLKPSITLKGAHQGPVDVVLKYMKGEFST
jgi:hypothetical protein